MPLKITRETNYSKDKNLWHLSHEGLDLEDPASEPQYDKPGFLEMGVSPAMAPDQPLPMSPWTLRRAVPVAIDGEKKKASDIIQQAQRAGRGQRHRPAGHRGEPAGGHEGPRRVRDPRRHHSLLGPTRCWR